MTKKDIVLTINGVQHHIIKLDGHGQCACYNCEQTKGWSCEWTSMCYEYEGHIYCYECLKALLERK